MGRRFRRFANQVIKVTRRIFNMCSGCGAFGVEVEDCVVPIASIVGGNGGTKQSWNMVRKLDSLSCQGINDPMNAEHDCSVLDIPVHNRPCFSSSLSRDTPVDFNPPRKHITDLGGDRSSSAERIKGRDVASPSTPNPPRRKAKFFPYPRPSDSNKPVVHRTTTIIDVLGLPQPLSAPTDEVIVEYASGDIWYTIGPEDWTVHTILARGGFGEIKLAMLGEHNQRIAIKTCNTNSQSRRESELLAECQSDFVIQLCACLVKEGKRYICMSYYELGDLWKWLQKDYQRNYFGETEAIWVTSFVLTAVQFIHEKRILHLDIKPANILLDCNGYPLLADFGAAIRFSDGSSGGHALTPAYASPEMLDCKMPDRLADLWPTACTFYEIIEGKPPCFGKSMNETKMKATLGITPDVTKMSPLAKDFIESQLRPVKEQRLGYTTGASAVMKHPIFDSVQWEDVKYASRATKSPIVHIIKELELADEKRGVRQGTITVGDVSQNNNHRGRFSVSSDDFIDRKCGRPPRGRSKRKVKKKNSDKMGVDALELEGYFGDGDDDSSDEEDTEKSMYITDRSSRDCNC